MFRFQSGGRLRRRLAQRLDDGMGNMVQGQRSIHHAQFHGCARHAVNHASGLVLRQIDGSRRFQLLHSLRPIPAHAREQHAQRVPPGAFAAELNNMSTAGRVKWIGGSCRSFTRYRLPVHSTTM